MCSLPDYDHVWLICLFSVNEIVLLTDVLISYIGVASSVVSYELHITVLIGGLNFISYVGIFKEGDPCPDQY